MSDSKELIPIPSDSASIASSSASISAQRRKIPKWEKYGFSSQESCEFGSIQFFKDNQKHKKNSKFVIIEPGESPDALLTVLLEEWKLDLPKLLIHLVGVRRQNEVDYDKTMGKTFSKELIQAISHTDVWLLTNGLHHGITESVGKLLADSATEIAMATQCNLVAIGMGPASITSQMEKLRQSMGGAVDYKFESSDDDSTRCRLDPSHTHFIIEDDRGQYNTAATSLRDALIDSITQCKIQQSNANVPVVYILFGGDGESLLTIYNAVVVRKIPIPVIIVAGSGGVADRLAGRASQSSQASDDSASGGDEGMIKMREIMSPSRAHLVTVYREDQKMDEALLLALMNANRGARGQNELLLAVIWNRIDLARKELLMNKNWIEQFQEVQLAESLQYALIHDQHKFVELFLERDCIDLQKFLTRECLINLYYQIEPHSLLRKLLNDEKNQQGKDLNSKPDLGDIDNILKQLVGLNSFNPGGKMGLDGQDTFSPRKELFVWAVLKHRKKMAMVFWKYSGMSIGGALLASKLLKTMSSLAKEPEVRLDMLQHGRDFQDRAVEVMNLCYAENQRKTSLLLTRVLTDWGNATCLEFAFAARNKQFICQAAVQNLLRKLWMGRLSSDTDLIVMWICTLFPPAALVFVNYTPGNYSNLPVKTATYPSAHNESLDDSIMDESDSKFRPIRRGLRFVSTRPQLQDAPRPSKLAWWYKLKLFMEAPVISFSYHLISHLLFLFLFSYILLKDFTSNQSPMEVILMFWVLTLFLEEFRELIQEECTSWRDRFEAWLWGYWNIVDLVALVMFTIGMVLRYTHDMLVVARIVLALDLIVFYLRILQFFSVNKFLGPKLIMIVKMMVDIVTFMSILFVFLVAYGVAFQSILYPNEQDSLTIVRGVLYQPYFQMYGELFLADLHREECNRMSSNMTTPTPVSFACPENSWFGTIVLAFYLFISNIMLLNLLIAMLNYTFATVQDNTDTYWKFQRFELVKEYNKRPVLAPPFIIIAHVYLLARALRRFCLEKCGPEQNSKREQSSTAMRQYLHDGQVYAELSLWESIKGKDYLASKEKQHNRDALHRLKHTDQRLEKISTDSEAMSRDMMQRLASLQTHVDKRLTIIETQMAGLEQLLRNLCDGQLPRPSPSSGAAPVQPQSLSELYGPVNTVR